MPRGFSGATSFSHCSGVLVIGAIVFATWELSPPSYNADVKTGAKHRQYATYLSSVDRSDHSRRLQAARQPDDRGIDVPGDGAAHISATGGCGTRWSWRWWRQQLLIFSSCLRRTFTIADPQNWVALFSFLVTAVVASNLAERARREAEGAKQRRREVERLFGLSQRLLASDNVLSC